MKHNNFEYLIRHKSRLLPDLKQRITYSFYDEESTIIGAVEEDGNNICLYEYRGKYIGTEFLISFAKDSTSYQLKKVDNLETEPQATPELNSE